MKRHTALLAGATGLVGGECLRLLLGNDAYSRVTVVTRRELPREWRSAKLHPVVTDFEHLGQVRDALGADHVYCALGTTIRKAGSRARFRQVDQEFPLRLAQLTRMEGASHLSIVSALGADARSRVFYSRVKGEVEDALRAMNWPSLAILRPSVIAGDRKEPRPMERLAEHLLRFAPATWKPVPAADIAGAMIHAALSGRSGVRIVQSRDIPAMARAGRGS